MFSGKIFRSRWAALLWAAGIIWTAYDVAEANTPPKPAAHQQSAVQAQPTDAAGSSVDAHDLAVLAKFAGAN